MIRIPTIVIFASLWMGILATGVEVCLTNPYIEHSCFIGETFKFFMENKEFAYSNCTMMNCCWNATESRCYAKTLVGVLPQNVPYQSTTMPQNNPYVQPVKQQPYQQNQHQAQPYQQPSYNPNYIPSQSQYQQQFAPPARQQPQQNQYTYQQQNQYHNPSQYPQQHQYHQSYQSQSQYPNHQSTNHQQTQYQSSQYQPNPNYPNQQQNQYSNTPGASPYSNQPYGRPTQQKKPSNTDKLLTALGMPTRKPSYGTQYQQGPMGTSLLDAVPKQTSVTAQLASIDQCSLANSIESEASRKEFQSLFSCTGNEPKIPKEQAQALLQGIAGDSQGATAAPAVVTKPPAATPAPSISPQLTFPVLSASKSVGGRLPAFGVQPYRPPPTNARICLILKSLTTQIAAIMKLRYRCGATGNALIDLATGNSPKGLGSVPSIIELFGFTKDAPVVSSVKEGSINPNLIPSDILTKCITNRYTYPSCRSGYNVNINTETECFNAGCLFFKDTYGSRCFKCDLVPASAYRLQDSADTCTVTTQEQCDGFLAFQMTVASIDMRGSSSQFATTPAPNPLTSLFSSNPTLSALLQSNPELFSSLSSNPLTALLRSGPRTGSINPHPRQLDLASLLPLLTSSSSTSSTSSSTSLLLNALTGGRSSMGSTGLLLSALSGGSDLPGTTFPKLSKGALTNLKTTCETKGCCWAANAANRLGGTCYKKGVSFPTSCLPTPDSGKCGKSLDVNDLQRVVGGTSISSATSRPWMAMIQEFKNGAWTFRCGGVQICSQWILTTASCLQRKDDLTNSYLRVPNVNPATIRVFVGTLTPAIPGPQVDVEKIIVHPGYNTLQSYNDIALLKIRSISFSAANSPVCLPPLKTAVPAAEQVLYFTGYGKTSSGALADFASLKELPLTVKAAADCNTAYPGTVLPQSGIFCAQPASGTDTCYGDGGSPIVQYDGVRNVFTLYGINFGGSTQCDGSKPALFTSITNFMPWIAQSTNGCCSVPGSRYVW